MADKLQKYVATRDQYEAILRMGMLNVGIAPHLHDAVIAQGYPQKSTDTLAELALRGLAAEPMDLVEFASRNNLRSFNGQPAFTQDDVDRLAGELLTKRQFTVSTRRAIKNRITVAMRLDNAANAVADEIKRRAASVGNR